ncbi:MAG TPA: hypothetical protein VEX69_02795 [Candidatus Limnocylindria bacterium]|nr:hypothetical protein [Candidatus Limnocylindria bacterium]
MNSHSNFSLSANFYRFAAACSAFYVVAQITQEITFHSGINDSASGELAILQRLEPLDQFRLTVILLSFFPIVVAFGAVALRRAKMRPAASLLGFAFSLLFVIGEIINRSIDLFVISRRWAVEYQAATSPTVKQLLADRIQIWDETFGGYYFVLRMGLWLGCLCFAVATWEKHERWNQVVAVALAANALRAAGRLAESYMGQAWLGPVNEAVYFPATLLIYGTLAAWLWRQAGEVQQENLEAAGR